MLAVIFNSFLNAFQNSSAEDYPLNFHQLPAHRIFEASAKMEQRVGEVSSQIKSLLLAKKLHQSCTGSGGISWIS